MLSPLYWLTLALAAAEWTAVWRSWHKVRWITKPGTLLALIAWFTQISGWQGGMAWFGLGLVFSLLGDILLLLPPRFFIAGLAAFLLAHIGYILGFSLPLHLPGWKIILPLLVISGVFILLMRRIRSGLHQQGEDGMLIPVTVYSIILSLMLLAALSTLLRPDWQPLPALLVSTGAGLFFISDSILANDRFVHPMRRGDLMVMVAYQIGQILITAGVLANIS